MVVSHYAESMFRNKWKAIALFNLLNIRGAAERIKKACIDSNITLNGGFSIGVIDHAIEVSIVASLYSRFDTPTTRPINILIDAERACPACKRIAAHQKNFISHIRLERRDIHLSPCA